MPTKPTTIAGARTQEQEIIELLDAYQAASDRLRAINKEKPELKPVPVPATIEEYEAITGANTDALAHYESNRCLALNKLHEADCALYKAIPSNVWIALPSREISIGFSTGTWGGHCHTLQIAKDGEPLPKLEHTTYYP